MVRKRQALIHRKFSGDGSKLPRKLVQVELETLEVPFDSREIKSFFTGLVLFEMKNVPVVAIDEIGNRCIDTLPVGALH